MSLTQEQHTALKAMRVEISQAIVAKQAEEMYRGIGRVQGFLAELQIAGEIDQVAQEMLEQEAMTNVYFQLNSLEAAHAH
ncbi:MAG: hypothetical protein A3J87_00210 [Sideroxydans sp. RIFOXYB12_FULL_59_6]|nr:MAG: hypothetical protein A3J87_00210 [Sideroxydans sp. RIFOXYB12_FULL_59_6]